MHSAVDEDTAARHVEEFKKQVEESGWAKAQEHIKACLSGSSEGDWEIALNWIGVSMFIVIDSGSPISLFLSLSLSEPVLSCETARPSVRVLDKIENDEDDLEEKIGADQSCEFSID
eukprot:SAG11_NODE_150_length_14638_cov_3.970493_5_plen_117_part_00